MVVHELRTPLMPVLTAAALLGSASPTQLLHMKGVIERKVEHLVRLVDDLMDVSRAESGKFHLRIKTLDLAKLLRSVHETCEPAITARGQRLELRLPHGPVELPGDAERLRQVFANLVFNACKYTPEGGRIAVEVEVFVESVVVSVSDGGIGIDAAMLPRVFDAFAQERRATRYNGDGLGLGLAVVRELTEAHGGSVVAHSAGLGWEAGSR
ncbi:sensor histidine kinase [Cognatilysobacter lacus]|nr:HAMP domain-containing sensor histidine kinase [Lysobacter lacus]